MSPALADRERKFVLSMGDQDRRLVAHLYKHDRDKPANVWFSIRGHDLEEPSNQAEHEDHLVLGFEAEVAEDTAQQLDRVAKGQEGLEHQEEIVTRAFFDTVLRSKQNRERLMKSYPGWFTSLLQYVRDKTDEVRTEYYFRLDSRAHA